MKAAACTRIYMQSVFCLEPGVEWLAPLLVELRAVDLEQRVPRDDLGRGSGPRTPDKPLKSVVDVLQLPVVCLVRVVPVDVVLGGNESPQEALLPAKVLEMGS